MLTNVIELRPGTKSKRTERFIQRQSYWYYRTREGVDIGPYDTLTEARVGADEFVRYILQVNPGVVRILQSFSAA